jgi:hypothetical protein
MLRKGIAINCIYDEIFLSDNQQDRWFEVGDNFELFYLSSLPFDSN